MGATRSRSAAMLICDRHCSWGVMPLVHNGGKIGISFKDPDGLGSLNRHAPLGRRAREELVCVYGRPRAVGAAPVSSWT